MARFGLPDSGDKGEGGGPFREAVGSLGWERVLKRAFEGMPEKWSYFFLLSFLSPGVSLSVSLFPKWGCIFSSLLSVLLLLLTTTTTENNTASTKRSASNL